MTNNLQQLDKKEKIFLKKFGAVSRISLFGHKTGCALLLRHKAGDGFSGVFAPIRQPLGRKIGMS